MIVQTAYPPTNLIINDLLKTTSGECYTYIGNFVNYIAPSGYIIANVNEFTATTATTYVDCISCLTTPQVKLPYIDWRAKGEYSISCPVCELTNFGGDITFYTSSADTTIQTGVYIYENTGLTTPVSVTYVKYDNKIYNVSNDGEINEFCTVNNNC
jgi:hypothetical protein